jgi:hypothetical protein
MDLLLPSYIHLDESGSYLHNLLAEITGYSIIERATAAKTQDFRSVSEIEELWDIMCARVIDLITDTVNKINDPKVLLTVKESVTLFMQTIQVIQLSILSYFYRGMNFRLPDWTSTFLLYLNPTRMFSNADSVQSSIKYDPL